MLPTYRDQDITQPRRFRRGRLVTLLRRPGQWLGRLALLLQVGVTGLPVLDAALFHDARAEAMVHIEAAGANCHTSDCVLGLTLQSGGERHSDLTLSTRFRDVAPVADRPVVAPVVRGAIGIPVGPRAPPCAE